MTEFSTSYDLDQFGPFLSLAAAELDGDLASRLEEIVARAESAEIGGAERTMLTVTVHGSPVTVEFAYEKEDVDTVDFRVWGSQEVVGVFSAVWKRLNMVDEAGSGSGEVDQIKRADQAVADAQKASTTSVTAAMSPTISTSRGWTTEEYRELLEELRAIGVRQVWDTELREIEQVSLKHYPDALPILLRWLPRMTTPLHRYEVAAALTSGGQPNLEVAHAILTEYRKLPPESDDVDKGLIAGSIHRVAHDGVYDEIVERIVDTRDPHRREFILALGKMRRRRKEALALLLTLLDDEEAAPYAMYALSDLRAVEALPRLRQMLGGPLDKTLKHVLRGLEKKALGQRKAAPN